MMEGDWGGQRTGMGLAPGEPRSAMPAHEVPSQAPPPPPPVYVQVPPSGGIPLPRPRSTGFASCLAGGILLLIGGVVTQGIVASQSPYSTSLVQNLLALVAFLPGPLTILSAGWIGASPGGRSRWGMAVGVLSVVALVAFSSVVLEQVPYVLLFGGPWIVLGVVIALRGAFQAWVWGRRGSSMGEISWPPPPPPPRGTLRRLRLPIATSIVCALLLFVGGSVFLGAILPVPPPKFVLACDGSGETITLPAGNVTMDWTSNGPLLNVTVTNATGTVVYDVTSDSSSDAGSPTGPAVPAGPFVVSCTAVDESSMGPFPEMAVYAYS